MKNHVIKWQPTRERDTDSLSPYQEWVEKQGFTDEPALANPDVLPAIEDVSMADEFAEAFIDADGEVGILSYMEQEMFNLHVKRGMNLTDICKHLKISKSSGRTYFKRMQTKLKALHNSL